MGNFENILSGSLDPVGSSPPKNASGTAWIPLLLLTAPVERNLRHVVVENDLLKADLNGEELCTRIVRDASSSLFMGAHRQKVLCQPRTITKKGNSTLSRRNYYVLAGWSLDPFLCFSSVMGLMPMLVRFLECPSHPAWPHIWTSRDCCLGGGR